MSLLDDETDPILDGLTVAIRKFREEQSGEVVEPVVTGYVVIAEWIGPDGDRMIYGDTLEDQRNTHTLGMLRSATLREEERCREQWEEDD